MASIVIFENNKDNLVSPYVNRQTDRQVDNKNQGEKDNRKNMKWFKKIKKKLSKLFLTYIPNITKSGPKQKEWLSKMSVMHTLQYPALEAPLSI